MTVDDIIQQIGTSVRSGRSRLGITRKQLAVRAGVSERYLHELENGSANASIGIIGKVADALGLPVLLLLGGPAHGPANGVNRTSDPRLDALLGSMSASETAAAGGVLEAWLRERRRSGKGLALLGLRGAGKSTLGRLVAERQGLPFLSITREVEARAGMSLAELFNLGGPDAYRTMENEVVAELVARDQRIVLETAGGIAANAEAMDLILANFRSVWLKATPEEHLARVAGQGDMRPMRGNPRAIEHLRTLLGTRAEEYARAEVVIDTSGRDVDDCARELERVAASAFAA